MNIKAMHIFKFLIFGFFLAVSLWFGLKYSVYFIASKDAKEIIDAAASSQKNPDDFIKKITTSVFESFENKEPSEVAALKFRSYVSNRRLPDFMKWHEGSIETLVGKGLCDNATRKLSFILNKAGYESEQWNMITPSGGHSALRVSMPDGRKVLVDPFFGLVTVNEDNALISPDQALNKIQSGKKLNDVFEALGDESNDHFYKNYQFVSMAAQGEQLIIKADIPDYSNELILGEIDSLSKDVFREGNKKKIGPYWHYMGHKYDANWVRVLRANKPTKVTFTLTDNVDDTVIISEPLPEITGNEMVWELQKAEEIRFYDGKARLSLKRRNSFIDVDQIKFSRLEG